MLSHTAILDIGTGATAIYPTLGCALDRGFTFTATDIDATSLANAARILQDERNNGHCGEEGQARRLAVQRDWPLDLASRIALQQRTAEQTLIPVSDEVDTPSPALALGSGHSMPFRWHATMCNPPFYSSSTEMEQSLRTKKLPPSGACSGALGEMVTAGGEVAFVSRMIDESLTLQKTQRDGAAEGALWYTSMLGKASSIAPLVKKLRGMDVNNYGLTTLVQGQTRRWVILWSFHPYRLPDRLVGSGGGILQARRVLGDLPPSNTMSWCVGASARGRPTSTAHATTDLEGVTQTVRSFIDSLPACTVRHWDEEAHSAVSIMKPAARSSCSLFVQFTYPSWTRAARRAAAALRVGRGDAAPSARPSSKAGEAVQPVLCAIVGVKDLLPENATATAKVSIRWTYGRERQLFQSFASSVFRKLTPEPRRLQGKSTTWRSGRRAPRPTDHPPASTVLSSTAESRPRTHHVETKQQ